jgi:protein O-mannosyl-transferase
VSLRFRTPRAPPWLAAVPRTRAVPLLLALLPIAVYLPSLGASFQFDDWSVIVGDARVASLAAWWAAMPGIRPLLKATYALNHELGSGPAGFRAVNLLLHGLNTLLLFALLRRVLRAGRLATQAEATFVAAVAALVFALHPVQTESVTYVSGRSNLLAAAFALASLLAWRARAATPRGRLAYGASLLLLAGAVASKESAAVTPLAMLLVAQVERPRETWRHLLAVLPAFATVALLLAAGLLFTRYDALLATSLGTRGPFGNLALQIDGVWYLLGQLWRWDRLNADPLLLPSGGAEWFVHALVLKALLVTGLASLSRQRVLALALLWFFTWLLPTNSFVARLDPVNDRQLYLAIVGPALLLASALLVLRRRFGTSPAPVVSVLAVLLALGTANRNRVYADEVRFWSDVTAKTPANARAHNNLGMAHATACEPLAAEVAFERAASLSRDPRAAINLALLQRGELPGVPANCVVDVTVAPGP